MSNVKEIAHHDEPTENYEPITVLLSSTERVSTFKLIVFGFHGKFIVLVDSHSSHSIDFRCSRQPANKVVTN